MKTIYGVEAYASFPGGKNFEIKISYWTNEADAQVIFEKVQGLLLRQLTRTM